MDDAHAAVEVAAVEVRRRVRMNEEDARRRGFSGRGRGRTGG
jgi:hypothetical protein